MTTRNPLSPGRRSVAGMTMSALIMLGLLGSRALADDATPKAEAQVAPTDETRPPTLLVLTATLEDGAKTPLSLRACPKSALGGCRRRSLVYAA